MSRLSIHISSSRTGTLLHRRRRKGPGKWSEPQQDLPCHKNHYGSMCSFIHHPVGTGTHNNRLFQFGRGRERDWDSKDTPAGCHIQSNSHLWFPSTCDLQQLILTTTFISFQVTTIEHDVLKEGKLGLRKFMEERGYIFYRTVSDPDFVAGDSIFVHNSVQLTKEQLAIVGTDDDPFWRPPRT